VERQPLPFDIGAAAKRSNRKFNYWNAQRLPYPWRSARAIFSAGKASSGLTLGYKTFSPPERQAIRFSAIAYNLTKIPYALTRNPLLLNGAARIRVQSVVPGTLNESPGVPVRLNVLLIPAVNPEEALPRKNIARAGFARIKEGA